MYLKRTNTWKIRCERIDFLSDFDTICQTQLSSFTLQSYRISSWSWIDLTYGNQRTSLHFKTAIRVWCFLLNDFPTSNVNSWVIIITLLLSRKIFPPSLSYRRPRPIQTTSQQLNTHFHFREGLLNEAHKLSIFQVPHHAPTKAVDVITHLQEDDQAGDRNWEVVHQHVAVVQSIHGEVEEVEEEVSVIE